MPVKASEPTVKIKLSVEDKMKKHDSEVFLVKPPIQPFVSNDNALLKRKREWSINKPGKVIGSTQEQYDLHA